MEKRPQSSAPLFGICTVQDQELVTHLGFRSSDRYHAKELRKRVWAVQIYCYSVRSIINISASQNMSALCMELVF
jgi:hypothetical protein